MKAKYGFSTPVEFLKAQLDFQTSARDKGLVGKIVNTPETEIKTLKSYFVGLDIDYFNIIPTFQASSSEDLYALFKKEGTLVAKPEWGAGSRGVRKLFSEKDVLALEDVSSFVFQPYLHGEEKRMWIVDGNFVDGKIFFGGETPFDSESKTSRLERYTPDLNPSALDDLVYVQRMASEIGMKFGSVDFLGDKIHEVNVAGTGFTAAYADGTRVVDARSHLYNYIRTLLE